jgi:hypothetical protein
VRVSTGAGAAQLIVPLMLVIIGLRLLARAAGLVGGRRETESAREDGVDSAGRARAPS